MIIQERWPALVKSGSNIVLPASTVSIAYLKVGGRALSLTSQLSVAIPALTANTRYQVFCVAPLGVPALVVSTNENSVGPVGYASWKLVGSFYADGLASVGFGSFVTITGAPVSEWYGWLPVGTWTSNVTYTGMLKRFGKQLEGQVKIVCSGAPTSAVLDVDFPGSILMDTAALLIAPDANLTPIPGSSASADSGVNGYTGYVGYTDSNTLRPQYGLIAGSLVSLKNITQAAPITFGASDYVVFSFSVPIASFSNIPLVDL